MRGDRHTRSDLRLVPSVTSLLVVALCSLVVGCTVSFSKRDPLGDGGLDASLDASGIHDGQVQLDGAADGATIPDAEVDAGCPPGTKWCDTACVSVDSPATGCAQESCEACAFDHASALCVGGACALGTCENQWGNCDTQASTGCETDLASTLEHCSECNHSCVLPNANMSCESGGCQFHGCLGSYQDCDENLNLNGCETDTQWDGQNCGSCNYACTSGFECNNNSCRCYSNADCDTGGGGTCNPTYRLCMCPSQYCDRPCDPSGNGCMQ